MDLRFAYDTLSEASRMGNFVWDILRCETTKRSLLRKSTDCFVVKLHSPLRGRWTVPHQPAVLLRIEIRGI